MKNKIIFLILAMYFVSFMVHAQSRKEQIELLKIEVDSLDGTLKSEKNKTDSLNKIILRKSITIDSCLKQQKFLEHKINDIIETNKESYKELEMFNKNLQTRITLLKDSVYEESQKLISTNEHFQRRLFAIEDSVNRLKSQFVSLNVFEKNDFVFNNFDFIFEEDQSINFPENTKLNGTFTSYYNISGYSNNGKKIPYAKGSYKKGFKEGHWIYYLCDGTKQYEGDYKNGLKVGIWQNFDFCHMPFNYLNKKQLEQEGYLSDLYFISDYYSIEMPKLVEVVRFNKGIQSDTLYYYDMKGILMFKISNMNGNIYYSNGQILREGSVEKGRVKIYFNNGQLKSNVSYTQTDYMWELSSRQGSAITYYKNGQIESKGNFEKGNGIGDWIYYEQTGRISQQGEWQDDNGKYGPECTCQ